MKKNLKYSALLIILFVFCYPSYSQTDFKVPGIRTIFLNKDDLPKFGIILQNEKAELAYPQIKKSKEGDKIIFRKFVISRNKVELKNSPKIVVDSMNQIIPRLIVVKSSTGSAAYFSRIQDFNNSKTYFGAISSVNQVHQNLESELRIEDVNNWLALYFQVSSKKGNYDVYLWYEPTKSVINKIDEQKKNEFYQEINENSNENSAENKFINKDAQSNQIIIESKIYPMPVEKGTATYQFKLSEPRNISIALFDMNGNKISDIITNEYFDKGKNGVQMDFENLASGMYIAAIITDRGEHSAQRFIVINH